MLAPGALAKEDECPCQGQGPFQSPPVSLVAVYWLPCVSLGSFSPCLDSSALFEGTRLPAACCRESGHIFQRQPRFQHVGQTAPHMTSGASSEYLEGQALSF